MMQSLRGLVNFFQTAQSGSFTAASKVLGISAVAVGKNVSGLEKELGVRLVHRSTRQLKLTDEGRALIEQSQPAMRELELAYRSVRQRAQSPSGLVRVSSVTPFGRSLVQPVLHAMAEAFPKIQIELVLEDKVVDLIADGFDIGVRVGQMIQPTLLARPIAALSFVVVGAPSYFRAYGVPLAPNELARHKCLSLVPGSTGGSRSVRSAGTWRLGDVKHPTVIELPNGFRSNDGSVLLAAALQGQGLAYCPLPLVMPHLRRGELQVALPEWRGHGLTAFLHYPSRKNLPARVKVVVDYMLEKLRQHEDLAPSLAADLNAWVAHTPRGLPTSVV
jgi:DNA-binding transcriptional LysR family regulator